MKLSDLLLKINIVEITGLDNRVISNVNFDSNNIKKNAQIEKISENHLGDPRVIF